jgi:tetratricopeptide (TPR) repeat protein
MQTVSPLPETDAGLGEAPAAQHPRVFISYSHDSHEHADRVLDFADRLRRDGVETIIDQYVGTPPNGWPLWMEQQLEDSDFVLLVCTETYHRRVSGREEPDKGRGVRWEGMLIYNHIYYKSCENARFIPVLFHPAKTDFIPGPVMGTTFYVVDDEDGYERLYRHLTRQRITPAPLAAKLRLWRRDPDQADRFADVRRHSAVVVQSASDGRAIVAGEPHLTIVRSHGRRRAVRSALDVLNPFCRAVPLVGRETELAGLQAWLTSEKPIAGRGLVGPAGTGKTRLAIELCDWAEAREWRAGFVEQTELMRFLAQQNLGDWGWNDPTLAVIDGSAAVARVLRQWLVELAYHPGVPGRSLRLLLLERHADRDVGWWHDLVTPRSFQEDGLVDLFEPPEPCSLPRLEASDCHRLTIAGADAAAALCGTAASGVHTTEGDARDTDSAETPSINGEPLFLLMDAISASQGRTDRLRLAERLAQFELGRLKTLGDDRRLKGDFLCHMAAFVTLAGGVPVEELGNAIASEQTALGWAGAGDVPDLRQALRDCLSEADGEDGRTLLPILPDLIGEAAVLAALRPHPAPEQAAAIRRAFAVGGKQCVATVVRSAQDYATGNEHPTLLWLNALVETATGPAELMTISDQMPERTVCMIEKATDIDRLAVEAQRRLLDTDNGAENRLTLARCLTRLASRLRDVYRLEDALSASAEAVDIHRALDGDGDATVPVTDRAQSLLVLAGAACELGRRDESLAASSEAVEWLRHAPHAVSRPRLARALAIMSSHLSDLGRREEALAAAEEAVAVHSDLVAEHAEAQAPAVALALLNLAYCHSDLGGIDHALASAEASVDILSGFARRKPDAFRAAYAQALNSSGVYLARVDRVTEALGRSREAIAIQRDLAAAYPEAYRLDLALMLNGLAMTTRRSGDVEGSRSALDEAVAILRELSDARPEAHRHELAKQLNNQTILLVECGETRRAVDIASEAIDMLRELARVRPDRYEDDLATALGCLAFAQQEARNPDGMLACADESVAIRRRLAQRWPTVFRPKLGRSLLVLAEALKLCGRDAEAEPTAREATALLAAASSN